ncbi:MAG: MoxR family ATPase [Armatimonadota bacterium]|nr:MoxR family ATPase [Armatimonadota bacterium]MDW8026049.1 MoxR family ATPase [Armatimonadota bacterium]
MAATLSDAECKAAMERLSHFIAEVEKVIVGKRRAIKLVTAALLGSGHALIEDIPGVGKTTLAKAMAKASGCEFKRIQCTPDLLPSDITGTSVYDQRTGEFVFRPGPIFAHIVLVDEINRATPRTQASLLECMEEFQVTVDGVTHKLPRPFFLIATENPIEQRGTYPLPESQKDRFLIRVQMGYPEHDEEVDVLSRQEHGHPIESVEPVLLPDEIVELKKLVLRVHVAEALRNYIVTLVEMTRRHQDVLFGASPRGSIGLMRMSQAWALMHGRNYILPDDIKELAIPVLSHRLILQHGATLRGITQQKVVEDVIRSVPVPIAR